MGKQKREIYIKKEEIIFNNKVVQRIRVNSSSLYRAIERLINEY
jgi:hypothetical protein